jgi:ribosomal protein S18 acetylase RimI-like enzyme
MIEELTGVSEEIVQAFGKLMPQLTEFAQPPSRDELAMMVASSDTFIFLARDPQKQGEIIGTATLAISHSPTGRNGWIEDVVVDQDYRHRGWGKALTEACLVKARELGLRQVNLTSRPSRVAANHLYQSLGFVQRETNVYRYSLD